MRRDDRSPFSLLCGETYCCSKFWINKSSNVVYNWHQNYHNLLARYFLEVLIPWPVKLDSPRTTQEYALLSAALIASPQVWEFPCWGITYKTAFLRLKDNFIESWKNVNFIFYMELNPLSKYLNHQYSQHWDL